MSRRRWEYQLYVALFGGKWEKERTRLTVTGDICRDVIAVGAVCVRIIVVMMYTRASASDYDDWKTVYENPGWGSKDLIPLLRKVGAIVRFFKILCASMLMRQ